MRRRPRRDGPTPTTPTSRSWPASSGARVVGRKADVMLMGGFPYVVEAVGLAAVGHRGAAGRGPPGHRPAARRGRRQRGRPDADLVQGGRAGRARSTTPSIPARPRARRWRRTGTPSTGLSTSWPPGCFPDVVVTHEFALEDYRDGRRDRHRPEQLPRHQGRLPSVGGEKRRDSDRRPQGSAGEWRNHERAQSGKCIIVTGAASGIGWACANRLIEEGARVVGSDIDRARRSARRVVGVRHRQIWDSSRADVADEGSVVETRGRRRPVRRPDRRCGALCRVWPAVARCTCWHRASGTGSSGST